MNVELLEQTYKRIKRRAASKVDMEKWCGTAACIAGHAILDAGYTVTEIKDHEETPYLFTHTYGLLRRPDTTIFGRLYSEADTFQRNGQSVRLKSDEQMFEVVAREELGLTQKQGRRLFYPDEWPREFAREYALLSGPYAPADYHKRMKALVLRRLRKFIDTNGKV